MGGVVGLAALAALALFLVHRRKRGQRRGSVEDGKAARQQLQRPLVGHLCLLRTTFLGRCIRVRLGVLMSCSTCHHCDPPAVRVSVFSSIPLQT